MFVFIQQQLRLWASMSPGESGFTLIELLVVMLILSVLAAIALPSFTGQAQKARDARAKESAHAAMVAMESCMVDTGDYGGCDAEALRVLDPSLPEGPQLKVTVPAKGTSYTIAIQSQPKTQIYEVKRSVKGALTFPCKKVATGGCPASGEWG